MSHIHLPGSDAEHDLITYDADGAESTDELDGLMTQRMLELVAREPLTDVFVMSHGWKVDLPSARGDYDAWLGVMAQSGADLQQARQRPRFRPYIIGLHWPSQPWADEEFGGGTVAFATMEPGNVEVQVEAYAMRIAATPVARQSPRTVLTAAQRQPAPQKMPADVRAAYTILDREVGLGSDGDGAAPGKDREPFDPDQHYEAGQQEAISFGLPCTG